MRCVSGCVPEISELPCCHLPTQGTSEMTDLERSHSVFHVNDHAAKISM